MATFNTERLKQLTAFAIRGAGFDKLYELSNYIGIRVEDGTLYLNTTDGTNHLSISDTCDTDDIDVTVDAELFTKLISKITSKTVDITLSKGSLVIAGNGTYKLELKLDEEGNILSFPDNFPKQVDVLCKVSASDLLAINTTVQASLDKVQGSVYTNYYFGDIIAGTDKKMVSSFNHKIFDKPMLLNRGFVDLMCLSNSEVTISRSANKILAESNVTDNCSICVCTIAQDDLEGFNIEGINKFTNLDVKSFCRIRKADMLELLDRLALFVNKFDEGAINLHFTNNYIEVSSIASSGIELIEYTESKDATDIEIKVNIERLRTQLKSYNSDIVDLYYGNDVCIKLVDGDMTQVIALIK